MSATLHAHLARVELLEGAMLDAAVAIAEGYVFGREWPRDSAGYRLFPLSIPGVPTLGSATLMPDGEWSGTIPRFSRDWNRAGAIVHREKIAWWAAGDHWCALHPRSAGLGGFYWHEGGMGTALDVDSTDGMPGPDPITAAMRAWVAVKLGDAIALPPFLLHHPSTTKGTTA